MTIKQAPALWRAPELAYGGGEAGDVQRRLTGNGLTQISAPNLRDVCPRQQRSKAIVLLGQLQDMSIRLDKKRCQ